MLKVLIGRTGYEAVAEEGYQSTLNGYLSLIYLRDEYKSMNNKKKKQKQNQNSNNKQRSQSKMKRDWELQADTKETTLGILFEEKL